VPIVFKFIKCQTQNIRFTVEYASDTLSFLDVEIKINGQDVDTGIWRKSTNTGLLLNFDDLCPQKWKSGLIICMIVRAKRICSNISLYNAEVKRLKQIFHLNGTLFKNPLPWK